MKLLFDENLSPSLVRRLADLFPDSAHVHYVGLSRADDTTILNFAREHDYVVVTKDADYRALRLSFGKPVPRVAWIRLGNGSTTMIEHVLRSRVRAIEAWPTMKPGSSTSCDHLRDGTGLATVLPVNHGRGERLMPLRRSVTLIAAAVALLAGPAWARCSKNLVERTLPGVWLAKGGGETSPNRALITFLGHASYQIDTPQGVRAITDYNGVNGFGRHPDIVTMNNAHSTHFTDEPEEGITYVLRGWPNDGEAEARHDVTLKDMRVWNVPTNARDWSGGVRINGNSIFIYAIGDLCIAHLGHLHHRLTPEHLEALGRIDVLMVPIDGSFTMGVPFMADVVKQIDPRVVLPMHYWGRSQLDRFMGLIAPLEPDFIYPDKRSLEVVKEELPEKLTVIAVAGDGGG